MSGPMVDSLLDEAEQVLACVATRAASKFDVDTSRLIIEAWQAAAAGEHGVGLLQVFRERLEKVLGPIDRRDALRRQVLDSLDSLDDSAVAWLLGDGRGVQIVEVP